MHRRTRAKSFKSLPQFPAIVGDVAMIVEDSVTHAHVLGVGKNAKLENLVDTRLFDVFRGKNVSEGQKSMAYTFVYRNADRTLTDDEVNNEHAKLVAALNESLTAIIRDK